MTAPESQPDMRQIEIRPVKDVPAMTARPDLDWISIERIVIDDSYQRPLGRANWEAIAHIARNFRWARFTPVLLAPLEDGRHALIDGQHRTHAAAAAGHGVVPAMLVPMTPVEQAEAFAWINGNVTAMTVFHIYKAALAARADWAITADQVVAEAGARLMPYNSSARLKRPGQVYAIGLIRDFIQRGRRDAVLRGLGALVDAGVAHQGNLQANVLRPWLTQVQARPDLSRAQLVGFLGKIDLEKVADTVAQQLREPRYRGQTRIALMQLSLRLLFDKQFGRVAA